MDKTFVLVPILSIVFVVAVLGGTFAYNLPAWCATLDIGGNYIVQPLCQ